MSMEFKETYNLSLTGTAVRSEALDGNTFGVLVLKEEGFYRELQTVVNTLSTISLEEMGDVRLMNRTDVKYLVPQSLLPELISKVAHAYSVQEIGGKRMADYGTLYLDTDQLLFFRTHLNGKLNRCKWRIRCYLDSELSFLELKLKTNTGRTRKQRIPYEPDDELLPATALRFIRDNSLIDPEQLVAVLQNRFSRITLVNRAKTERLTIDLNITFKNCLNGKTSEVPRLAIVELKRDRFSESVMANQLTAMRIRPCGISKYCLGVKLTSENIKGNLYKQKIRYIHKIIRDL